MTERDFDVDYSERAGFMVGKSAAIAEWSARREKKEFAKLVARLSAAKTRRENPEHVRALQNAWRARNREHVRIQDRAYKAKRRRPRIIECIVCGVRRRVRAIVKDARRSTKFCSRKCSNKYWGKHRKYRYRGLRCMTITADVLTALRAAEGLSLRELRARTPHLKPRSVATTLTQLKAKGLVYASEKVKGKGKGGTCRRWHAHTSS